MALKLTPTHIWEFFNLPHPCLNLVASKARFLKFYMKLSCTEEIHLMSIHVEAAARYISRQTDVCSL
jgi:hypothetical protein